MRNASLFRKCFSLPDPESVLLICHHQRQLIVIYGSLDQGVGSHDNLCIPAFDPVIGAPFFFRCHRSGQKFRLHRDLMLCKQLCDIGEMLSCQHLRGRHDGPLHAFKRHRQQGKNRHDRLSGSHVSLDQPGHHGIGSHIRGNLLPHLLLRAGQFKGKPADQFLHLRILRDHILIDRSFIFIPKLPKRQDKFQKFLEHQPFSCLVEHLLIFRKMNPTQGKIILCQPVFQTDLFRQRLL